MDIDVRDITPHLLTEQSSAREDFNVWLTVIKPNMVVENTLCVMVDPMWQVNQCFGEHGIIARRSLSHYQRGFDKLWEDEQAWRNKVRELGLDVTRWRINPFAPGEWAKTCDFYATIAHDAPELKAVARFLKKIKDSNNPHENTEGEILRGGFYRVKDHPNIRINLKPHSRRYTQIVITVTVDEEPIATLDNPDVTRILKQFNNCLTPVQEPWKGDAETLLAVAKELSGKQEGRCNP